MLTRTWKQHVESPLPYPAAARRISMSVAARASCTPFSGSSKQSTPPCFGSFSSVSRARSLSVPSEMTRELKETGVRQLDVEGVLGSVRRLVDRHARHGWDQGGQVYAYVGQDPLGAVLGSGFRLQLREHGRKIRRVRQQAPRRHAIRWPPGSLRVHVQELDGRQHLAEGVEVRELCGGDGGQGGSRCLRGGQDHRAPAPFGPVLSNLHDLRLAVGRGTRADEGSQTTVVQDGMAVADVRLPFTLFRIRLRNARAERRHPGTDCRRPPVRPVGLRSAAAEYEA